MSLSERIAKLNLQNESSSSPSTSAQRSTPPRSELLSKSTGAKESVKDKAARFTRPDDAPVVPAAGSSFGFNAPMKRQVSQSSDKAGSKGRVASLGLGRAAVPLDVVDRRRISADSSGSSTYYSSMEMSRDSSSSNSETGATSPSSTRSPVAPPVPASTGPPSLSSLNVETGSSSRSEVADMQEQDTPTVKSAVNSPLSSPLATPTSETFEAGAQTVRDDSVAALPSFNNSTAPAATVSSSAAKGPLASLRAPPRNMSAVSVSSLLAEDGSVAGDDHPPALSDVPEVEHGGHHLRDQAEDRTKTATEDDARSNASAIVEESEEAREAAVKAELDEYEREQHDKPMQPVFSSREPTFEAPVEPPEMPANEATRSPTLDDVQKANPLMPNLDSAPREAGPTDGDDAVNAVKCSDCGANVDLLDLTSHICAPVSPSRARTSPSQSRSATKKLDAFVSQTNDEVPEDVADEHAEAIMAASQQTITGSAPTRGPHSEPEHVPSDAVAPDDVQHLSPRLSERRPSVPSDVPADEDDGVSYGSVTIVRTGSRP